MEVNMKFCIGMIIALTAVVSFGAQGKGFFIEGGVVQGKNIGDTLWYFRGTLGSPAGRIGAIDHDSLRYIVDGKEQSEYIGRDTIIWLREDFPVKFQYAVSPSFLVGYEHSFNKVLSVRGALGYMKSKMDVLSDTVVRYHITSVVDTTRFPAINADISSHWFSIPLDLKVMLPIRRGGLYATIGPKATILLSSKYTDNLHGASYDVASMVSRLNFMVGFQIGAEIAIAKIGHLFFEGGYHLGFTNMSPISTANSRMGNITPFCMGFRLDLPK
jgi:hypothetical protein